MKIIRVPFSRVSSMWLRRALMVLGYLPMLAGNWLLILWAAVKMILLLPIVVALKALAAPFQLIDENFANVWHGREPKDGGNLGAANTNKGGDREADHK